MKKLSILASVLMVAVFGLATMSWAGEASVFDDAEGLIIRAYTEVNSAYIDVRNDNGVLMDPLDLVVTLNGAPFDINSANPFLIHDDDLVSPDISAAIDDATGIVYVFCTDGTGLHVMQFDIGTILRVDGLCGSSDGGAFYSAPTTGLCSAGTETTVTGSGPWYWDCEGLNGGDPASCSANLNVDGVCGPSDGGTFTSAPTTGLCSAGTETTVTGSGPWAWQCLGEYDGTDDSCSANVQGSADSDLTVTYFMTPGVLTNPFSSTITVKNIGTGPAGQFKVKILVGEGWTPAGAVLVDNSTRTVTGLAPGEEITFNYTDLEIHGLAIHRWYRFFGVADADNEVAESNEDNNYQMRDFRTM